MEQRPEAILLASASPRRRDLLASLGVTFEVRTADVAEEHHPEFTARELAVVNASRKAAAVARLFPDRLVLGADTLVTRAGALFGKPADMAEAGRMLAALQGATHQVVTGVCLMRETDGMKRVFAEITDVTFRPLTQAAIADYLSMIQPLDKAGAYAIQEHGERIVERIDGSYSNVVGLPVERLQAELTAMGIGPLRPTWPSNPRTPV